MERLQELCTNYELKEYREKLNKKTIKYIEGGESLQSNNLKDIFEDFILYEIPTPKEYKQYLAYETILKEYDDNNLYQICKKVRGSDFYLRAAYNYVSYERGDKYIPGRYLTINREYMSGLTLEEISEKHDITTSTIRFILLSVDYPDKNFIKVPQTLRDIFDIDVYARHIIEGTEEEYLKDIEVSLDYNTTLRNISVIKKKVYDAISEKVIELYKKPKPISQIMRELGLSRYKINNILDKEGLRR